MKNDLSVETRNAIVEVYLPCIDRVMRKNAALIRAARLDRDDVYQQLALRLIRAVDSFDPDKGKLETHIMAQLNYELLNCKHPYRRYGITGLPAKDRCCRLVSLEQTYCRGELPLAA